MRKAITLLLLILSLKSHSQTKYTILERGWEKSPIFADSIVKQYTKNGGFPVFTKDLDSLLLFVGVFRDINKASLKRTYFNNDDFKTQNLFFSIANITHAYGDLYAIDITSIVEGGTYKITLASEKGDMRSSKSYIRAFYKYIKKAIEIRNKLVITNK